MNFLTSGLMKRSAVLSAVAWVLMLTGAGFATDYSVDLTRIAHVSGREYDETTDIDASKQVVGYVTVKNGTTSYAEGWDFDVVYEYDTPNAKGHPQEAKKILVTIVPTSVGNLQFNPGDRWVAANAQTTIANGVGVLTLDGKKYEYIQAIDLSKIGPGFGGNGGGGWDRKLWDFEWTGSPIIPVCGVNYDWTLFAENGRRLDYFGCDDLVATVTNNIDIASEFDPTAPPSVWASAKPGGNFTGTFPEPVTFNIVKQTIHDPATPLVFKCPLVPGENINSPAYTTITGADIGTKYTASIAWINDNIVNGVIPSWGEGEVYTAEITLTAGPNYEFYVEDPYKYVDCCGSRPFWYVGVERMFGEELVLTIRVDSHRSEFEEKLAEASASLSSLKKISMPADLLVAPYLYFDQSTVTHDEFVGYINEKISEIPGWTGPHQCWDWTDDVECYTYTNGIVAYYVGGYTYWSKGHVDFSIIMSTEDRSAVSEKGFVGALDLTPPGPAKVSWTVVGGGSATVYEPTRITHCVSPGNCVELERDWHYPLETNSIEVEPNSEFQLNVTPSNGYTLASWSPNVTKIPTEHEGGFSGKVNAGGWGTNTNVTITLAPKSVAPYSDSVVLWWGGFGDVGGTMIVQNGGPTGAKSEVLQSGARVGKVDVVKMLLTPASGKRVGSIEFLDGINIGNKGFLPADYIDGPVTVTKKFTSDGLIYFDCVDYDGNRDNLVFVTFDPNGGQFKPGFISEVAATVRTYIPSGMYGEIGRLPGKNDVYREGNTLIGWATTQEKATKGNYDWNWNSFGISVGSFTQSTTIYAVWKDNKALVREAKDKIGERVSNISGISAGGFDHVAATGGEPEKWTLDFTETDIGSDFSTAAPTITTAENFITSKIVLAIQTMVREELGTDEINVTIADGSPDADSPTDINGVAASAVVPVLSDLITRENGEKGYEFTYWLKVKRNPYVYVGPYIVWIPHGPIAPPAKSLTEDMLSVQGAPFTYDGLPQTPSITVKDGVTPLVLGTDYENVAYESNTNAGVATVTVTGKGSYKGTASATFTINPAPLTITDFAITKQYNGSNTVSSFGTLSFVGLVNGEQANVDVSGVTATYNSADVGTGKAITIVGAFAMTGGTANPNNYTITQPSGITGAITKASGLTATTPATIMILNTDTDPKTFDLSTIALNKTDAGALVYSLGAETDGGSEGKILQHTPELVDGKLLKYQGNGNTTGTATQVINITSDNYENVAVTITFEATSIATYAITVQNDGNGTASASATSAEAGTVITLTASPDGGYQFKQWQVVSGGVTVTNNTFTMPAGAVTVKAVFELIPITTYTVTFNPNGGAVSPTSGVTGTNGKLTSLPTPTRSGYTFDGWYTASTGGDNVTTSYVFSATATIYARWTQNVVAYTITFDPTGGAVTPSSGTTGADGRLSSLPTPTRSGYTFNGWYTASAGGTQVTTGTTFGATATIYARWTQNVVAYTITFDPTGGAVTPSSGTTGADGRLSSLPTPTRSGYAFDGWFTSSTGGARVTTGTTFNASTTIYAQWTSVVITYTVLWSADGGIPVPTQTTVDRGGSIAAPAAMTKAGYAFGGWYANSAMTSAASFPITNVTENITLYAKWTPIYTITFNPVGGAVSPTSGATGADRKLASLPIPTRSGYAFDGWYTASSGGTEVTVNTVFGASATVYARWTRSYVITFDADGGAVSPASSMTGVGGTLASLPVPMWSGYAFDGWYTSSSGGARVTASTVFGADATIYARWAPSYRIAFNPNGGAVSPASSMTGVGGTLASLPVPTRSGYTFDGWYTASTGGEWVTTGTVFSASATIYARWTLATYMITFDAAGGAVSPAYGITAAGGKLASLPTPAARTGYTFDGWHTEKTGGARVTTSTVFTEAKTIYARWTPVRYGITYNLNNGAVTPANPTSYTIETADITLNNPTRIAYTFAGWTGSNGSFKQTSVRIYQGSTGDKSFTANWTSDTYTITFVSASLNGGAASATTAKTAEGGKLSSLPKPAARTGYEFDGWYTSETGGTKVTTSYVFGGDATVYARWTPARYTITYNLNGGAVSPANPASYTIETAFTLNNPTRTAYTFDGWTGANGTVKQKEVSVALGSTGNKSYTANWTLNNYTVTFDAAGGFVSPATGRTGNGGKLTSLPTPARAGYAFDGWYTSPSGGTNVTTSYVFGSDAVIYAHWGSVYTITFNANGGAVSPNISNTGAGGKPVSLPTPTRSGYVFEGWYTEKTGGAMVTSGTVFSSDAYLYARWTVSGYTAVTSSEREVPGGAVIEDAAVAPVKASSGGVSVGPNPVKVGGKLAIYWTGGKAVSGKLAVVDAVGQAAAVIEVGGAKKIGAWKVGDIAEGTYLIKGVLTDSDGVRVRVSALVAVVR